MKEACSHKFVSTGKKGKMTVMVKAGSPKAKPRSETISTTVFKCSDCGAIKDYPDTWEKNYILPD